MGYKFGGRQAGSKNKKTVERENLLSRAIGELNRPLGKDVLAEVMMTLRLTKKRLWTASLASCCTPMNTVLWLNAVTFSSAWPTFLHISSHPSVRRVHDTRV